MLATRVALCALLCVFALTRVCGASDLHAHRLRDGASNRHLAAQADDDAAACAAAASSSPFAAYLTAIPETGGLRTCAAANLNDLAAALSAKDSKCSLTTLVSLFSSSASDKDMTAFSELLSALLSGLTATTSGSSTSSASTSSTSSSLASFLASWSKDATKTQGFCAVMNTKVGPCAQVLVPAVFTLLRNGPKCCGVLAQYADAVNLLVPAGKSAEQMLFDLLNGLHRTMCTTATGSSGTDATALCGQRLVAHLAATAADSSAKSLLTALLFDAGLPLYALPDTGACAALETTSFASRVAAGTALPYYAASCCAVGLAALLEAVDAPLARLSGNSVTETLNLITARQSATKATQFRSPYDALKACAFTTTTCTAPAFVLPSNLAVATTESSASAVAAKTAQPQRVACAKVDVCDADKVCSSVCKPGSVTIAPWAARALAFQRNASYAQPLCFTQLPGSHNSATTLARGYGNRDQLINKVLNASNAKSYMRTNNQFLSLEDQLRIGARFLEIDVHYLGGAFRSGHCSGISLGLIQDASAALVAGLTTMLSGSSGANATAVVEWDASLFGCLPSLSGIRAEEQRLHSESLQEVAAWLKRNPTELLVLYTEIGDEVTKFGQTAALLRLYTAAFGDLIFTPADLKAKGGVWTSFPLTELIAAGKRVVLVATPKENDLMFKMTALCGGWSDIPGSAPLAGATTLWGKKYNAGSLVRAFHSALRYATLSESDLKGSSSSSSNATTASTDPTDVTPATLPTFVNAGVNILAPDGLDGAAMEAMVWSWAAKEPSSGDTAVEVAAADGRWYGVASKAAAIKYVACVSTSDRSAWQVVAQGTVCPSGSVAGAPVLAIENAALVAALRAAGGTTATAQLALDISAFPAISTADEKAFESASSGSMSGGGGASGGSSGTPTASSAAGSAAASAMWSLGLSAFVTVWVAAALTEQ